MAKTVQYDTPFLMNTPVQYSKSPKRMVPIRAHMATTAASESKKRSGSAANPRSTLYRINAMVFDNYRK
jgi:hypothetical protein